MSTSTERKGMRAVRGYIRATLLHRRLVDRLHKKEAALGPVRRRVLIAEADVRSRRLRMTGSQIGMAERLLRADEATLTTMLEPCKEDGHGGT